MRIGFNARLLASEDTRGWNRYTVNLLAALPSEGVELVLYSDRPLHPTHLARLCSGSYEVRVNTVRPYALWEQGWLPRACGRDHVEVLHAPANFGLPLVSPCPRVLTLHDAIDRAYYAPLRSFRERWGVGAWRSDAVHAVARLAADRIVTVSRHAADDLVRCYGLRREALRVIGEAADPLFLGNLCGRDRVEALARHDLSGAYLLYVGGGEGRKNLPFLIEAFAASGVAETGVVLAWAGGVGAEAAVMGRLAGAQGVGGAFRPLGRVADAELPGLYAHALAFVYPSRYEGFGLQLCEAMACGCPVLAARATSLPEVLGEGGATFGLGSVDELAGLLRRVVFDARFREELKRSGAERSSAFSWARTAAETAAVYRELVRPGASGFPGRAA